MKLIRLEVQNFCQHQHKVVEFNPRLTAFLGQNGSGKSNLLTAALGALTNDFSRTHGNKAENICQTAPESEPSYVKLLIEHDGSEVEIQRGFRKAQSYWQQGEDRIRGDTAVTARVLEFLGTTKRIINDYLFGYRHASTGAGVCSWSYS
jgi:DNA repair exonuclease SbcCD ATPase subunit